MSFDFASCTIERNTPNFMLPAFLITFREVIEAALIVATILGLLVKLKHFQSIKILWLATVAAAIFSLMLLVGGSVLGFKIHTLYTGRTEQIFEGTMMLTSAIFMTWAVFWLHKYFARRKLAFLRKIKTTVNEENKLSLFALVFTSVFREGFEIVLFLSTIFFSSKPASVFTGFGLGGVAALVVALSLFTATFKLSVFRLFQTTTVLLILFAAGLAARGVHEFTEAGLIPQYSQITLAFLPSSGHFAADLIKSLFGWSKYMDSLQLVVYATYLAIMRWYLFIRPRYKRT